MINKAVIIPCAGKGTRLGIPYAKELFSLEHNKSLIDYCFDILYPFRHEIRVIIIISAEKMELVKYLSKYADDYEISFIYQKNSKPELLGAIESAKDQFLEYNLLMLPDIRVFDELGTEKIRQLFEIAASSRIVFGAVKESDKDRLSRMGALRTLDDTVYELVDKPKDLVERFDSYWIYIEWRNSCTDEFLRTLRYIYNTPNEYDFENTLFFKQPAVFFKKALDMGVWENIVSWYKNREENEANV